MTHTGEREIGAVSGRVGMYGVTYHQCVQKLFEFTNYKTEAYVKRRTFHETNLTLIWVDLN